MQWYACLLSFLMLSFAICLYFSIEDDSGFIPFWIVWSLCVYEVSIWTRKIDFQVLFEQKLSLHDHKLTKIIKFRIVPVFFGNRFEMLVYIGGSIKIDINGQWYTNKHDFTSNIFFYPYSINHISNIITTMTIQSISLPNIFRILIPSPTSSKITMQQNLTTNGQKYNYFQFLSDIRIVHLYQ